MVEVDKVVIVDVDEVVVKVCVELDPVTVTEVPVELNVFELVDEVNVDAGISVIEMSSTYMNAPSFPNLALERPVSPFAVFSHHAHCHHPPLTLQHCHGPYAASRGVPLNGGVLPEPVRTQLGRTPSIVMS